MPKINFILFVLDLNRLSRPDLFVKNHTDVIDSQLTLAFSKAIKQNKYDENVENDKNGGNDRITVRKTNDTCIPQEQKAMMPNKDRNKSSILIPQMRSHVNHHVPLLPNGSELQRRNKSIVLTHTCAFDSIASIYAAIYVDNPIMRSNIDNSTSKFAAFIKLLFQHKEINSKIEFARYEFLRENFPDKKGIKELPNLVSFNCDIAGLFSTMCLNNDILASRQRTEKCSKCAYEKPTESPFVNYSTEQFEFKNVQKSIVAERNRVCGTCNRKTVIIEDEFHDIVAIDCESITGQNEQTSINNIEKRIKLKEDEYELFAAVQYDSKIKHFIPHIKRSSNDWETHDDLCRTKSDTNIDKEMNIFMLFYKRKSNGKYLDVCVFINMITFSSLCIGVYFIFITEANNELSSQFSTKKKPLPKKNTNASKTKSKSRQSKIETDSEEEIDESPKEYEEAWKNLNRNAKSQSIFEPKELRSKKKMNGTK